jgi:hypothetical protein
MSPLTGKKNLMGCADKYYIKDKYNKPYFKGSTGLFGPQGIKKTLTSKSLADILPAVEFQQGR